MAPHYLNEFHKRNSQACRKDLQSLRRQRLSVEDVLRQSRMFVRQIYDTDDLVGDGRIQERLVELDISSISQLKQTLR